MPKLSLSLPKKGKILVSPGDKIEKDSVLAEYQENTFLHIDLGNILKISPRHVYETLIKKPGSEISEGEIIAQKKTLFGKRVARSPINGLIVGLEEKSGQLEIETSGKNRKLISPVSATIDDVVSSKTVVLDFNGDSFDVKIAHGNKCAKIYLLTREESNTVSLSNIEKRLEHQILVGFSWPLECIRKAFALECGVIGVNLEGQPDNFMKTGNLDQETLSFMVIGRDLYQELVKLEGKIGVMIGKDNKLFVQ